MATANCEEKTALFVAYQQAAELYANAVAELISKMGLLPKNDYETLSTATEQARHLSLYAKERLECHIAAHGCENKPING